MDIILDSQFNDIELLAARTRAWDLDFRLTQKGGFTGEMKQVALPYLLVTHARFRSGLHQAGSTPAGFVTFALPAADCHDFWWLGYDVDANCVLRFGSDSELAGASNDNFAVYTVSLRRDYFENLLEMLKVPSFGSERRVTPVSGEQIAGLLELAKSVTTLAVAQMRTTAAHQLAERLVVLLGSAKPLPRPTPRRRDRAIRCVTDFLQQHGDELPDVATLCNVAHVSERTLQYAFRERYGISPNAFIRYWQLNAARKILQGPDGNRRLIATVAAQCGFHDASVFARHYRSLHGELPSNTVAKALS